MLVRLVLRRIVVVRFERFTAEDSGGHPVNIYTLTQRRRTACQWGIFLYIFFNWHFVIVVVVAVDVVTAPPCDIHTPSQVRRIYLCLHMWRPGWMLLTS